MPLRHPTRRMILTTGLAALAAPALAAPEPRVLRFWVT